MGERLTMEVPGNTPWPTRQEAVEAAWLIGAPFAVQIIDGAGDDLAHVLAGLMATTAEGQRLLDARWRVAADAPADVVLASVRGDPARHDFGTLARALACAARVVKAGGRIVLLTDSAPALGASAQLLRRADDPNGALDLLQREKPPDRAVAFEWAQAARQATLFLLSRLPADTVEELFAVPLEASEVQRLLGAGGSCLVLPDADKMMAFVRD
jgi:hypothetical protein